MSLKLESPKKSKTKNSSPQSPPLSSSSPSFSLLPDEISVNCLARISRSNYPRLSLVSKGLRWLLSSTELYLERSRLGNTEHFRYFCLYDQTYRFAQWFTIWVNPNQTLPNSSMTNGHLLVPIPSPNFTCLLNATVAVVGPEIYVIGGHLDRTHVRVLDCRSHTWRDAPSMNVPRNFASSCVYDGKIYVLGGCKGLGDDEPWAEVFDTKTQSWERLSDPDNEIRRNCHIFKIKEVEGKIKFGFSNKMYAYDTKQGKWECYENENEEFGRSGCLIQNVSFYSGSNSFDTPIRCYWYDIKDGKRKEVKGLDSLGVKHMRNGGSSSWTKVVSSGGKLLLIWEVELYPNPNDMKRIWCAEIMVEKRNGGEVWGNVEWVDVLNTVPTTCNILHCLDVCL